MLKISKKGNIVILVLFVMMITSISGLLIVKYIDSLLAHDRLVHDYYKSYYITNGGLELQLNQLVNNDVGFENEINTGSNVFSDNFECSSNNQCSIQSNLYARSELLFDSDKQFDISNQSNIDNEDKYNKSKGEGFIIPLYWTNSDGTISKISKDNLSNITVHAENNNSNLNYIVAIVSNNNTITKTKNEPEYSLNTSSNFNGFNPNDKNYLVIANLNNEDTKFYVESNGTKLPNGINKILSTSKYNDTTVTLEAIRKDQLPDYLIYGILD